MPDVRDVSPLVIGLIVVLLIAAGPSWGKSPTLGDGTANITIVAPAELEPGTGMSAITLRTTPGRFGAAPTYLRTPTLVVDVTSLTGRPKLVYRVEIPEISVQTQAEHLLTSTGRVVVGMNDVAFPSAGYQSDVGRSLEPGTYEGRIVVMVQSFTSNRVVANRTVTVEVGA